MILVIEILTLISGMLYYHANNQEQTNFGYTDLPSQLLVYLYHQKVIPLHQDQKLENSIIHITELSANSHVLTLIRDIYTYQLLMLTPPSYVYTHYNDVKNCSNVYRHAHIATHFTFKGRYEYEIKYACPMGLPSTTSLSVTPI